MEYTDFKILYINNHQQNSIGIIKSGGRKRTAFVA